MAAVGDQIDLGAEDVARVVIAHLPAVVETMAAAGDQKIVVPVQAQLDRAAQPDRRECRHAGEQRRLGLLAAKAAAHASALHLHLIRLPAQRAGHQLLHLAGVLGRAMNQQRLVLLWQGVADLAFQVELLLPADGPFAAQPVRGGRQRGRRIAAAQVHRRQHVLLSGVGGQRGQDRRQHFNRQCLPGQRRRATRQLALGCDDGEHRLPQIAQLALGQDRVVVQQRAAVVFAGEVGGGVDGDDAGLPLQQFKVDGQQAAMRHRRQTQRCVQGAGGLGDVVDVGRLTADMQGGGFVRAARSHNSADLRLFIQPIDALVHAGLRSNDTACQTLISRLASGASARVSSHSRWIRFCATRRR